MLKGAPVFGADLHLRAIGRSQELTQVVPKLPVRLDEQKSKRHRG